MGLAGAITRLQRDPSGLVRTRFTTCGSASIGKTSLFLRQPCSRTLRAGNCRKWRGLFPMGALPITRQNDGSGPSWVASIVTVILVTWDDWGGWYDYVAPNIHNSYEYGFRVPLIVISPYAKTGYASHVTHDFGSLLRFTEATFRLPTLGYADSRADDLSDCFDFSRTAVSFEPFAAKFDAVYFLTDQRPPTDPDDD